MAVLAITLAVLCGQADLPDIMLADFESGYGSWAIEGTAFGANPAPGTLPGQMEVTGFDGNGLANSYVGGDEAVGKLRSPAFTINRDVLAFLIGGGGWEGTTCMNLVVDGKIVRTATGPNTRPGGSERLQTGLWDVRDLKGHSATLEIIDAATSGWGHINVDTIRLTNHRPNNLVMKPMRTIDITQNYLNFPVSESDPEQHLTVTSPAGPERQFRIKLASGTPDYWVFLDARPYVGSTVAIQSTPLENDAAGLKAITNTSEPTLGADLYREPLRPQFHFSSRRGWLNDPNGLVFADGEYHMYYQQNPYGWNSDQKHWGHAVSTDLIHWKELPAAVYQLGAADEAWSGSAVVDRRNDSGWKDGQNELIVAAYTSIGRGECILYSNDRGRTFTEFSGNPVVKHQGRDPRLLWHAPSKQWVMALYDEQPNDPDSTMHQNISFYTSPDLKQWTYRSRIGGFYECPDIFELAVDGDPSRTKWVLTAADSNYMVGEFDGATFRPETSKLKGHQGNQFYAAQTFSDSPDGRRIQVGWAFLSETPGMPFNQFMTFPCELTLISTSEGPRLRWEPVRELESLVADRTVIGPQPVEPEATTIDLPSELIDASFRLTLGVGTQLGINVLGAAIRYDSSTQTLDVGGCTVSVPLVNGKLSFRMLADRGSVEVFADQGLAYLPVRANVSNAPPQMTLSATGGDATLDRLEIKRLKPIW